MKKRIITAILAVLMLISTLLLKLIRTEPKGERT